MLVETHMECSVAFRDPERYTAIVRDERYEFL